MDAQTSLAIFERQVFLQCDCNHEVEIRESQLLVDGINSLFDECEL